MNKNIFSLRLVFLYLLAVLVQSCGGGSDDPPAPKPMPMPMPMMVTATFSQSSYTQTVAHRDAQQILLTVSATASDESVVEYSITSGNDAEYFAINSSTGAIQLTEAVADASPQDYPLTVSASFEGQTIMATATVTITLAGFLQWEQETVMATPNFRDTETAVARVIVQFVQLPGTPVTYSLFEGNDAGYFTINADGEILFTQLGAALRTTQTFNLKVRATAGNLQSPLPASVTIELDDNIVLLSAVSVTVVPNHRSVDQPLAEIQAIAMGSATFTYVITEGDTANYFEIDGATGVVSFTASGAMDAPVGRYLLTIATSSSDSNTRASNAEVVIILANTVSLTESNYMATPLHRDPDRAIIMVSGQTTGGDAVTYQITQGNDMNFFRIDPASGEIFFVATTATTIPARNYVIGVEASDSAGTLSPASSIVTIMVGEFIQFAQDNPMVNPDFRNPREDLIVVSAAPVVGTATVTYAISAGNDAGYFSINPTSGAVRFTAAGVSAPLASYVLTIEASANNFFLLKPLTLTIQVSELLQNISSPSVTVRLADFEIAAPFFTIEVFSSEESSATISYTISSGNEDDLFRINERGQLFFKRLDFDTLGVMHVLTVTAQSSVMASLEVELMIDYHADLVPEVAFSSSAYTFDLDIEDPFVAPSEPADLGSVSLVATGVSLVASGREVTYAVNNCSACRFSLDSQGQFMQVGVVDFSRANQSYEIGAVFSVIDPPNAPVEYRAMATVDVNISPLLLFRDTSNNVVSEHTASAPMDIGEEIEYPRAQVFPMPAPSTSYTFSYSLSSVRDNNNQEVSNPSSLFTIVSQTGELTLAVASADLAEGQPYTLTIAATATAGSTPALMRAITITLNAPDTVAPTLPTLIPVMVDYTLVNIDQILTTVQVNDNTVTGLELVFAELGTGQPCQMPTTSCDGNPGNLFKISGLDIVWAATPPPGNSSYTISVLARDAAGNTSAEAALIQVQHRLTNLAAPATLLRAGSLTVGWTQNLQTARLADVQDIVMVEVGSNSYVYAVSPQSNVVAHYSIDLVGSPMNHNLVYQSQQTLSGGQKVLYAEVASNHFLIVSHDDGTTSGVSSYAINATTGSLSLVNTMTDSTSVVLDGARSMALATIGTATILAVAATDDNAVSTFSISDAGALAYIGSLADDNVNLGLTAVSDLVVFGNYALVAGENQLSVLSLIAGNMPAAPTYSSHLISSNTVPLSGDLQLALVSSDIGGANEAYALVVSRDDTSVTDNDGLVLIPINSSGAAPVLSTTGVVSVLDDTTTSFGEISALLASSLHGESDRTIVTLTSAENEGSLIQLLARHDGTVWTLPSTPLTALHGGSFDDRLALTAPNSASFLALEDYMLTTVASSTDGSLSLIQSITADLPSEMDFTASTYPILVELVCSDTSCAEANAITFSIEAFTISGVATFDTQARASSPPYWEIREDISGHLDSTSIVQATDIYLVAVTIADADYTSTTFIRLGQ